MKLVDANVLLYAVNSDADHHERSRRWLDASLSGEDTVAFAWIALLAFVRLDAERNNAEAMQALEAAIRQLPQVVACHYISGTGTFELQVVAQDLEHFSRFALGNLINLPNVKDLHTSFSLGEVKAGGALPLAHLEGARGAG